MSFHEHIHICVGGQLGLPFEHLEYPRSQLFFAHSVCVCVCVRKSWGVETGNKATSESLNVLGFVFWIRN